MGACTLCGLECPDDATLCFACAYSKAGHPDQSPVTDLPQGGALPYGWGKAQGLLLILGGVGQFSGQPGPEGLEINPYTAALNIVLGCCILRRNRLILPLMLIVLGLLIFDGVVAFIGNDKTAFGFEFGAFVWALFAVYY